ncbi:hypothetical protein NHJ6243_004314 [Beauveria neobassiana]
MRTSWFLAASSNESPEYQKLAVNEGLAEDKSEYKWKSRFQAMTAVYVLTTLCLLAVYSLRAKSKIGVEWALPSDVIFGHSKERSFMVFWRKLTRGTIPRERVLFTPDQSYSDVFPGSASSNPENATLWDALQPIGGGLIAVSDPRKLGLVGGLPLRKGASEERPREAYGISMFHQIHCLPFKVAIRTAIRTRTFNDQHLDHCLDYLRQAIMCTGDTTLEKVIKDDSGEFKPEIDGWGTVHECRSWHMLFEFAERQRA